MVKADAKVDYYADLELAPTADAEEIKKHFRALAKQYHPDRNPGHEVDVLAKFQAVQAAHEILSDAVQKAKYDADRAKLYKRNTSVDVDPYPFRKPAAPKSTPQSANPPFPPPPLRPKPQKAPFDVPKTQGKPTVPSGADKFNAFTRPPHTWDRTKFDEAARADAARGFASMRSGQSTPQPPPRPPRQHPTAPRSYNTAPSPDVPAQNGVLSGFPGMPRTASARNMGFGPGGDEHSIPRASAYANYVRGDRPQASNPQAYYPESTTPLSPTMSNQQPTSPLRHVRSHGFKDTSSQRPGIERVSSRYATPGGERTHINTTNMGRSASVKNSPIDRTWDESRQNGVHRPHSHQGHHDTHGTHPARHHSSSPSLRPPDTGRKISSSESSSGSENLPSMGARPKAQPRRRPHAQTTTAETAHRPNLADDPALTGQFSSQNYTRIIEEDSPIRYRYPPPESRDGPVRRPFDNMPTTRPTGYPGANSGGSNSGGGLNRSETWTQKYDTLRSRSRKWSQNLSFSAPKLSSSCPLLNGVPSWAVPSNVFPGSTPDCLKPIAKSEQSTQHAWLSDPNPAFNPALCRSPLKANLMSNHSVAPSREAPFRAHISQDPHSVSQENISTIFSSADWDGKFTSGDEYFRPAEGQSHDRKSPSRTSHTRARSLGQERSLSQGREQEHIDPGGQATVDAGSDRSRNEPAITESEESKAAAFQSGKFCAEEWAGKLKNQKWAIPNNEINASRSKTPKRLPKQATKRPPNVSQPSEGGPEMTPANDGVDPDAMDIDDKPPQPQPSAPHGMEPLFEPTSDHPIHQKRAHNAVDLDNFSKTAPFAPAATGLEDLDDIATNLPFESRPAPAVRLEPVHTSSLRRLNLPRPPKTVTPPHDQDIKQERWGAYVIEMNAYLHDWNVFNMKMLQHFRTRQDQINMGMGRHWISSIGDGPPAERFDSNNDDGLKAGYATYMTWLDDDAKCRTWWDEASERHRVCFENLGRIRAKVKRAAGEGIV